MSKQVRIKRVEGYRPGEVVNLPDNRALTYARNGQASPVGWSVDEAEAEGSPSKTMPTNRMMDTRQSAGTGVKGKKKSSE